MKSITASSFNSISVSLCLVALASLLISVDSMAAVLRGRIDGRHQYSSRAFPVAKARVEFYYARDRSLAYRTYTTRDGMYYTRDLPPGDYLLSVNGRDLGRIRVRGGTYQDLPPYAIDY